MDETALAKRFAEFRVAYRAGGVKLDDELYADLNECCVGGMGAAAELGIPAFFAAKELFRFGYYCGLQDAAAMSDGPTDGPAGRAEFPENFE